MDKKNISPNPQQPVDRQPAGKLPNLLAELEEASLNGDTHTTCLLYTSPSPRDLSTSRMPSSA